MGSEQFDYSSITDDDKRRLTDEESPFLGQPNDTAPTSVVAAFFLLGMGVLLPYNALLSGIDFYSVLFPNISVAQYITNAYTFPFMVTGIALALFPRLAHNRRTKVFFGLVLLTLLPAALPLIANRTDPILSASAALISPELLLTVFIIIIIGSISAMLQSILFGTAALCPGGTCTTAFSAGGGVASVFIGVLRIVLRIIMDGKSKVSLESLQPGFRTFMVTCATLCSACVLAFLLLDRYSAYYSNHVPTSDSLEQQPFADVIHSSKSTLQEIAKPAACLLSSFMVTLSLFPGILVKVPTSLRPSVSPLMQSWYPLIVVFLFSIGDTIGRSLPTEEAVAKNRVALIPLTTARVVLVPLYLIQWVGILSINWVMVILMVVALGIANGLIATWAFLEVPLLVSNERHESASRLMFVMLISGISLGNMLGWLVEIALHCATDF